MLSVRVWPELLMAGLDRACGLVDLADCAAHEPFIGAVQCAGDHYGLPDCGQLMRIRAIYAADDVVRRAPAAERRARREQHVRPLMTSLVPSPLNQLSHAEHGALKD